MFPAGVRPAFIKFSSNLACAPVRFASTAADLVSKLPACLCKPIHWKLINAVSPLAPNVVAFYNCPKTQQRFTFEIEDNEGCIIRNNVTEAVFKLSRAELPSDWLVPNLERYFRTNRPATP